MADWAGGGPMFDVLVSYGTDDAEWTRVLADSLMRRGLTVWLDRYELASGDLLAQRLQMGLGRAQAVLLVVSANPLRPSWVEGEFAAAVAGVVASTQRLIPVLVRDAPLPSSMASEPYIDFRAVASPEEYAAKLDELVDAIRRVPSAAGPSPEIREYATALIESGRLARERGDHPNAKTYFRGAFAAFNEIGDRANAAAALAGLGRLARERGDDPNAETYFRGAFAAFNEIGDRGGSAAALLDLGRLAQERRGYPEAESYFRRALAAFNEIGELGEAVYTLVDLGRLAQERGDYPEAESYFRRALDDSGRIGSVAHRTTALFNLGRLAEERGDLSNAEIYLNYAFEGFNRLDDRAKAAAALAYLGRLAQERGDDPNAESYLRRALTAFNEIGDRANAAATLAELGRLVPERGDYYDIGQAGAVGDNASVSVDFPSPDPDRYVNVMVRDEEGYRILPSRPLLPNQEFTVDLDVGPLHDDSAVRNPRRFPDWLLPEGDLRIDVVMSSMHFLVSKTGKPNRRSARVQLILPGDGGRAVTRGGAEQVRFRLRSPKVAGLARARISLYFRDAVVQSLRLDARVGITQSQLGVITDFTTSKNLTSLNGIPPRRRVSLVLNDAAVGNHQIVLRALGEGPNDVSRIRAFELPREAIAKSLVSLRRALASEAVAPTTFARSRQQLINDLRLLAPIGWRLNATLEARAGQALQGRENAIVHVCRTSTSTLTLPWNLLYDIYLDSSAMQHPERLPICPLLGDWDGRAPLITGAPRSCPRNTDHTENMLCPFGFWGFRQPLEILSSTDQARTVLRIPPGSAVAIATSTLLDHRKVKEHAQALLNIFQTAGHTVVISGAESKAEVRKNIEPDLPVIYFYCHGQRGPDGIYLAVGRDEPITPDDLTGWILQRWRNAHVNMWDDPRPLVVINACESLDVSPESLLTYLDVLIGRAGATGVIGTEVKVHQTLAIQFAEMFFHRLLGPPAGVTVDSAMHASRCEFLAAGNLFGLVYTPYCWADLVVDAMPVRG